MRLAVVGHVEWVEFVRVEHVPAPGEIVHALDGFEEVGGGGAVAAVQLARLAGECLFITALGGDDLGREAKRRLESLGVRVAAAWRPGAQRRGFVHVDAEAERTITVIGDRIGPRGQDALAVERARRCRRRLLHRRRPDGRMGGTSGPDARCNRAGQGVARRGPGRHARRERERRGRALRAGWPVAAAAVRRPLGGLLGGTLTSADGSSSRWAAAPLEGPPWMPMAPAIRSPPA